MTACLAVKGIGIGVSEEIFGLYVETLCAKPGSLRSASDVLVASVIVCVCGLDRSATVCPSDTLSLIDCPEASAKVEVPWLLDSPSVLSP